MTELNHLDEDPTDDGLESPEVIGRRPGKEERFNKQLLLIILALVVLWLSGIASALIFGLISAPAPRTSIERSLRVYGAAVDEGSVDPAVWSDYAGSLIEAKQYTQAERVIADALELVKSDRSRVLLQSINLAVAREDYALAVKAADTTLAECAEELKATVERYAEIGVTTMAEQPYAYGPALLLKAEALTKLGRNDDAVSAYDAFLKDIPRASDVLVLRGDLKAETGDENGAEADYREALKYISDYDLALDGLKRIGAEVR